MTVGGAGGAGGAADRERWRRLQEAFAEAYGLTGDAREAVLRDRCGGDAALEAEVRGLLAAAGTSGALDDLAPRLASLVHMLEEAPPERVGPYVVEAEAGRGGMGVVYRGYDPRLRRHVAIKLVARPLLADPTVRQRFVNEARLASGLDHPNICTIYDIGTLPDGRLYLAMAYYGQGTLDARIAAGPLPVEEAVAIACQLADALACAHEAGVVHRDVKPRNVAFGERGEVRLLDFGVALLGQDAEATGSSAGTPAYMAPEQVRGERADARADVWALGVVLFEMLTGRRPFEGDRPAMLEAIRRGEVPPIGSLRPDVPHAVVAVVERALRVEAGERFPSMHELAAALSAAATAPRRPATWQTWWVRSAAVLTLMAAAAATAFLARSPSPPAGPSVPTPPPSVLERGLAAYRDGGESLESGIALLRNAVEREPDNPVARAYLARAYARASMPGYSRSGTTEWLDSAEVQLAQAAALDAELADVMAARGTIARVRGQRDAAIRHHLDALARDPQQLHSMVELAMLFRETQQDDEAARWFERVLRIDPDLKDARLNLMSAYRSWEMWDEARYHIREGLALRPHDDSYLWQAVQVELLAGDTTAARAHFTALSALLSPYEQDRMGAWYEYIRGDATAALPMLDRISSVTPFPFDLRMAGLLYTAAGDTAKGFPFLRDALTVARTDAERPGSAPGPSRFMVALLLAGLGRGEEAIARLADWERAGGFRCWSQLPRELGWEGIRHDPRFTAIVARTDQLCVQRRERVRDALLREPGPGARP